MSRLSLLAGPIPPNPKQNFKQEAFLEYLKSFSLNGLQTLERLESQFNRENTSTNLNEDFKVFQKIKTLIGSYELFVLEMNDSCQFIEVPKFGTCLLKLFIHLIGILKWSLQQLLLEKQLNIETMQSLNANQSSNSTLTSQATGSLFNFFNSTKLRRYQKAMRNTLNGKININPTSLKQGCCPQCSKLLNPNNIYKVKEQATLQLRNINEEILRISKEYAEEEKKARQQDEERNQLQKFIEKREESEKKQHEIGLGDRSRNEDLLTEIVYTLSRKGQAMKRFADLRMTSITDSSKLQTVSEEDYQNLKTQVSTEMNQKLTLAKHKLAILFKQHTTQSQKHKKQQLIDTGVQIEQNQSLKMFKYQQQKQTKKLKAEVKRLEKQLDCQRGLNDEMRKLLVQKSIEFENQIFKYRTELLNIEIKSKKDTDKSKLQNSFIADKRPEKSSFYVERNSENSINQIQDAFLNKINEETESNSSLISNDCKKYLKPSFLKPGKRVTQPKSPFKFKKLTDNSTQLSLICSVFNHQITPTTKIISRQYLAFNKQTQEKQIIIKGQVTKSSCYVQTSDPLDSNKTLTDEMSLKQKNKIMERATKTVIQTPQTYRKVNVTSYIKKRSAHVEGTPNNLSMNKQTKNQGCYLLNYVSMQSKSSKFLQRIVKFNTVQNTDTQKEFIPLNLAQLQNANKGYQRKFMQSMEQNTKRKKVFLQKQANYHLAQKHQSIHNYQNKQIKTRFKSFEGHELENECDKENSRVMQS